MPQSLEFGFATADEAVEAGRVSSHSFPGLPPTAEWWDAQLRDPPYGGGHDTLFVGRQDGRVVASLQLHPLRQWIAGELFSCAGVGTVAISAAHRRRRLGADLVAASLIAARERGDEVSGLYPFRRSFYRKLGYGDAGSVLQYQFPPSSLRDAAERERVVLLDSDATRAEAFALYQQWARTQTMQLERTERMWKRVIEINGALAGYRADDGTLQGYAIALYRTDIPRRQRYLEIEEIVWVSDAARRGLYAWIASLSDQWEQVLLRALPSHHFGDWLGEAGLPYDAAPGWRLWVPGATLLVGPMLRIVDMQKAWALRRVDAAQGLRIALSVEDAQIAENSGEWVLTLEGQHARCARGGASDIALRLDIATLSRLFVSATTASAALAAGALECDRPDLLPRIDAALALPEPWLFDRF